MLIDDPQNIRWHLRFTLEDYQKMVLSNITAIKAIAEPDAIKNLKNIQVSGCPPQALIKNMCDTFFIDFINFVGVIKFVPFYLNEGVKSIYRLTYALIKITQFTNDYKTPEEFFKYYKAQSNKIENMTYLYDVCFRWELTHSNNSFMSQKLPPAAQKEIEEIHGLEKYYYIPTLIPNSEIISTDEKIRLWDRLPAEVKLRDGKLLFSKLKSPSLSLLDLFNSSPPLSKDELMLFLIRTEKDEIFGGILNQTFELSVDGKYKTPEVGLLITIKPKVACYYSRDRKKDDIVSFEPGALRFGKGYNADAIIVDEAIECGWTEAESIFGRVPLLNEDGEGEFKIKNFEVYLLQ